MKSSTGVLLAVLIVLTLVVVCYARKGAEAEGFAADPRAAVNNQLDLLRGHRHDAYNQTPLWRQPHGLDRYHRAGAHLTPEQYAEAEREQWGHAEASADGDYNTQLADLVLDPRTKDNHAKWVAEMKPWSGTAMTVDDMDEAMEASINFTGLRRPQAIAQYNPLQLTEVDTYNLIGNNKFNFRG